MVGEWASGGWQFSPEIPDPAGQASMIIEWAAACEAHGVWLPGGPRRAVFADWIHDLRRPACLPCCG